MLSSEEEVGTLQLPSSSQWLSVSCAFKVLQTDAILLRMPMLHNLSCTREEWLVQQTRSLTISLQAVRRC